MKKKFVSKRRAKRTTNKVWSFSVAVLALCIAVVSGVLLERRYGYHGRVVPASTAPTLQDSEGNRTLILHSIQQMANELAEIKVKYENLLHISNRLARSQGLQPGQGELGNFVPRGSSTDVPMEDLLLENPSAKSAEEIGRELDDLRKKMSYQEDSLRVMEFLAQSKSAGLERIPTTIPVSMMQARVTSAYGYRTNPVTGAYHLHSGQDFAGASGTPIYAASAGVVSYVGYRGGYGLTLEIDHGNEVMTRYAHTSEIMAEVGDLVTRRQLVARIGNTGRSTGPHLHFEIRIKDVAVDPMEFLGRDFSAQQVASEESSLIERLGNYGTSALSNVGGGSELQKLGK